MAKKKKHKKDREMNDMMKSYQSFTKYSAKNNDKKMADIEYELNNMIREIKKADKKYERMRAKVKKGKIKVDLKQYKKDHPIHARKKAAELFQSGKFLEIVRYILENGLTVIKVIAQMLATLIVLVLSCKKIREIIPIPLIEKMRGVYDTCSSIS